MVARPEIDNVKALRGKKIGINSPRRSSSADYAAHAALSRSGMDPNKDLTLTRDQRATRALGGSGQRQRGFR